MKLVGFLQGGFHDKTIGDNAAPAFFFWRSACPLIFLCLGNLLAGHSGSFAGEINCHMGSAGAQLLFAAHWGCQMNKLWRGRKLRGGLVNCLINSLQPHSSAWWQGGESSCSWWCWGVPLWLPSVAPSSSCSSTNMEFVSGTQQWECSGSSAGCCHPRVV